MQLVIKIENKQLLCIDAKKRPHICRNLNKKKLNINFMPINKERVRFR